MGVREDGCNHKITASIFKILGVKVTTPTCMVLGEMGRYAIEIEANLLNITTLLQRDPNTSNNMNSLIFKSDQDFIAQSGHFAME